MSEKITKTDGCQCGMTRYGVHGTSIDEEVYVTIAYVKKPWVMYLAFFLRFHAEIFLGHEVYQLDFKVLSLVIDCFVQIVVHL